MSAPNATIGAPTAPTPTAGTFDATAAPSPTALWPGGDGGDVPATAVSSDAADQVRRAERHVRDILQLALGHPSTGAAVVVSDTQCGLAHTLSAAYRACLPAARHLVFDDRDPSAVWRAFEALSAGDLVVLIQSTSFRLEKFRIRVELFKRGLKVIEHPHLGRMAVDEYDHYIDALAYDPSYYRQVGPALKRRIDQARSAEIDSGAGERLLYQSAFEPAKMNIGDYATMKNIGGQFPIGEVFTEPTILEQVHGRVRVFVFGDTEFRVNVPPTPITLVIRDGRVADALNATAEFDRVLANIRADEEVWVRELGFGMNRALTPHRRVSDIGTYERMCGVHLSLGAKHGVYDKPQLPRRAARYHVDVFAVTERVLVDGEVVFRDGAWLDGAPQGAPTPAAGEVRAK